MNGGQRRKHGTEDRRWFAQIEARLAVALVNRSIRRMSLTPEGEAFLDHARGILGETDDLNQLPATSKGAPKGLLRVNAALGFGRLHVAPVVSRYVSRFPEVDVQLQLSVSPPPVTEDQFDVCVRFGEPAEARIIARRLAPNRRLLCASPKYLAAHGAPKAPGDLRRHNCIAIRQGDDAYGTWRLAADRGAAREAEVVKVRGNLASNDGEIVVGWALDGHGILLRAEWDIARYFRSGRLVHVLPQYRAADADTYAVDPQRHQLSARVRSFVDLVAQAFTSFDAAAGSRGSAGHS